LCERVADAADAVGPVDGVQSDDTDDPLAVEDRALQAAAA
jgi:hypothetical protein